MAVQAQNTLPDFLNRPVQLSNIDLSRIDPRNFLVPFPYGRLDGCQQVLPGTPAIHGLDRMLQPVATPTPGSNIPNFVAFQQQPGAVGTAAHATGQRKRRKDPNDRRSQSQLRHKSTAAAVSQLVDLNQLHGCSSAGPQSGVVSTGLRLAFDDDRSTVTSSKQDVGSAAIGDELSARLLQQQDELSQLFKIQTEQLRHALEERTHLHSKALLSTVEEEASRRLRDRAIELERVSRRNVELEERIKQLSLETHVWQSKAKSYEAMVAVLRANLQQALVHHQSREQSKVEGCGDSEADDAASVHIDDNVEAQQTRALIMMARKASAAGEVMVRACKRCRAKEVSVLLLPCLHLCLCNDCKVDVERCPICNSLKTACVEVYLS